MKPKEQHEKDIVEIVIRNKICVIQHIFGHYTDLKSSQFYNLELEKSESIKDAISQNKSKGTNYLLNKWITSENPTLQIAAYRIICSHEERQSLNQQYVEHSLTDKKYLPEWFNTDESES